MLRFKDSTESENRMTISLGLNLRKMKRFTFFTFVFLFFPSALASVDCSKIRNDEWMCLACNIYHESGNQDIRGKIAVGAVTINRVRSPYYPDSICKVVWQPRQFSWTHDGKSDRVMSGIWWKQAMDIARGFLIATGRPHGAFRDPTDCALFYHADYVRPVWSSSQNMEKTSRIQNHIFYKNNRIGCPDDKKFYSEGEYQTRQTADNS